jgi:SAM-dependent methyltransferase
VDGLERIDGTFQRRDLSANDVHLALGQRPFDLIVLFGVLHHLPSLLGRRRLLEDLARALAPSGFLVLSFWQFGRERRFERRILDWSSHNEVSSETIDEDQLERGDFLLSWGNEDQSPRQGEDSLGARRYCHFADPQEALALAGSLGPGIVDRFESDGRTGNLNLYFVLQDGRGSVLP